MCACSTCLPSLPTFPPIGAVRCRHRPCPRQACRLRRPRGGAGGASGGLDGHGVHPDSSGGGEDHGGRRRRSRWGTSPGPRRAGGCSQYLERFLCVSGTSPAVFMFRQDVSLPQHGLVCGYLATETSPVVSKSSVNPHARLGHHGRLRSTCRTPLSGWLPSASRPRRPRGRCRLPLTPHPLRRRDCPAPEAPPSGSALPPGPPPPS